MDCLDRTTPGANRVYCESFALSSVRDNNGTEFETQVIDCISSSAKGSTTFAKRAEKLLNIYPICDGDWHTFEMRRYAASVRDRFKIARDVDVVCQEFGFMLAGQGVIYENEGVDWAEVDYGVSLQWLKPGDDDRVVHLELGDPGLECLSVEDGWNSGLLDIAALSELRGILLSWAGEVSS